MIEVNTTKILKVPSDVEVRRDICNGDNPVKTDCCGLSCDECIFKKENFVAFLKTHQEK